MDYIVASDSLNINLIEASLADNGTTPIASDVEISDTFEQWYQKTNIVIHLSNLKESDIARLLHLENRVNNDDILLYQDRDFKFHNRNISTQLDDALEAVGVFPISNAKLYYLMTRKNVF